MTAGRVRQVVDGTGGDPARLGSTTQTCERYPQARRILSPRAPRRRSLSAWVASVEFADRAEEGVEVAALTWSEIASRFREARNWWVTTAGVSGPHAVPIWGVVLDETLCFYGSPDAVRSRNLRACPRVILHLEDGEEPLIVHGRAVSGGLASENPELVELYRQKYQAEHDAHYLLNADYAADALQFDMEPTKALAWRVVAPEDWIVRRWTPAK